MEYRSLGRTGIQVSPLCLGAMMFGAWGEPDHDKSIKTIHTALDAGINFIDTADVYSQGESETIVGKALANGKRDDVVLATKVNIQMGVPVDSPVGTKGDPNQRGNSRRVRDPASWSGRRAAAACGGPYALSSRIFGLSGQRGAG
ncbi:MAG: aryl-alcohol dehydrogenase [Mycobacterium sp.]|nr:aryl-alcohol dehydrogenase [Mycobacterium sp.]